MLKVIHNSMKYVCEIPVEQGDQPVYIEPGVDCILIAFASNRWFCLRGNTCSEVYEDIGWDGIRSLH